MQPSVTQSWSYWWIDLLMMIFCFYAVSRGVKALYHNHKNSIDKEKLSWWETLASWGANSFSADTPFAVTGFVRRFGLGGNWIWLTGAFSFVGTFFFFAPMWQRSGLETDVNVIELRYARRRAKIYRAVRAILSTWAGIFTLGWILLGGAMFAEVCLPLPSITLYGGIILNPKILALGLCIFTAMIYLKYVSRVAGNNVAHGDIAWFALMVLGAVVFMVCCLVHLGSPQTILENATSEISNGRVINSIPNVVTTPEKLNTMGNIPLNNSNSSIWWYLLVLVIQSLAGSPGGGIIAMRLMKSKSPAHAKGGVLSYLIVNFILRPIPWYICAIASLIVIPNIISYNPSFGAEHAYGITFMRVVPPGLKGIVLASLFAALISTIVQTLDYTSRYPVSDLFEAFAPDSWKSEQNLKRARGLSIILVAFFGCVFAYRMTSVGDAWLTYFELLSGAGLVGVFSWFWWRINLWSEVAAILSSMTIWILLNIVFKGLIEQWEVRYIINVLFSTTIWILVTLFTHPEPKGTLVAFYERFLPGLGWGPIAKLSSVKAPPIRWYEIIISLIALVCVISAIWATPLLVFGSFYRAIPPIVIVMISGSLVAWLMYKGFIRDLTVKSKINHALSLK